MYYVDNSKCSEVDNCNGVKKQNGITVCCGCGSVVREENKVKGGVEYGRQKK